MIAVEVLQAIEEYAENYTGTAFVKDAVVHAAVYGYLLARQQLDEKDKEIARLKQLPDSKSNTKSPSRNSKGW